MNNFSMTQLDQLCGLIRAQCGEISNMALPYSVKDAFEIGFAADMLEHLDKSGAAEILLNGKHFVSVLQSGRLTFTVGDAREPGEILHVLLRFTHVATQEETMVMIINYPETEEDIATQEFATFVYALEDARPALESLMLSSTSLWREVQALTPAAL